MGSMIPFFRQNRIRLAASFGMKIAKRLDWRGEQAAQLAEFAVALPLLVVFVVGIFDFSGAFTLKQKLTNAAREAARAAASDVTTDLANGSIPVSVSDAFYVVDNYLIANNINDCGVTPASGTSIGTLTWKFTVASTSSSPCGITLIVNRGYYFPLPLPTTTPPPLTCHPATPSGSQTQIIGTCISLQYSYQWRFGQVASLLGRRATLPQMISAQAVAMNEF